MKIQTISALVCAIGMAVSASANSQRALNDNDANSSGPVGCYYNIIKLVNAEKYIEAKALLTPKRLSGYDERNPKDWFNRLLRLPHGATINEIKIWDEADEASKDEKLTYAHVSLAGGGGEWFIKKDGKWLCAEFAEGDFGSWVKWE